MADLDHSRLSVLVETSELLFTPSPAMSHEISFPLTRQMACATQNDHDGRCEEHADRITRMSFMSIDRTAKLCVAVDLGTP